ncbi:MAG: phosphoribosylformylglycinamidine synthase subunit PurQ [Verrucomicrobiae bacterium]|nr:phosphoribosylformylglycinamidine synthase subunit PurQ [Verrucomicrobiae bacterium]
MKFGIIQFPGSNCDLDKLWVLQDVFKQEARYLWHKDTDIGDLDCIVVPGGFSYGDYLRTGAIARFSPVMKAVADHAAKGKLVIGICNGFQILCEAGLLPGALLRNRSLQFRCEHVYVRIETQKSPFTCAARTHEIMRIPVAHGEGCYFADPSTIAELKKNDQILFRYVDASGKVVDTASPNGSIENIAGVCNKARNVCGMMPHPERASEEVLGSADGRVVWESILNHLRGVESVPESVLAGGH